MYKNKNQSPKISPYIIRLVEDETVIGTYRVSKEMFLSVQKDAAPYQTFRAKTKKVKCIETGEIFNSAMHANEVLVEKGLAKSYSAYIRIKEVCNKKKTLLTVFTGNLLRRKNKSLGGIFVLSRPNKYL